MRKIISAVCAAVLSSPAISAGTDHATCVSIVNDAYEAAETLFNGRVTANDLVVRNLRGGTQQGDLIDTGGKADDAIKAYIDTLSAACEAMR